MTLAVPYYADSPSLVPFWAQLESGRWNFQTGSLRSEARGIRVQNLSGRPAANLPLLLRPLSQRCCRHRLPARPSPLPPAGWCTALVATMAGAMAAGTAAPTANLTRIADRPERTGAERFADCQVFPTPFPKGQSPSGPSFTRPLPPKLGPFFVGLSPAQTRPLPIQTKPLRSETGQLPNPRKNILRT